jgi:hypothetical protein
MRDDESSFSVNPLRLYSSEKATDKVHLLIKRSVLFESAFVFYCNNAYLTYVGK